MKTAKTVNRSYLRVQWYEGDGFGVDVCVCDCVHRSLGRDETISGDSKYLSSSTVEHKVKPSTRK